MKSKNKKKTEVEWFDNPNFVTNLIILMISLIVILSQSFAVNNGLGVTEILSGILNHNIGYLFVFVYFISLKTKFGKRYFDFFNIFLIVFYGLTTVTSLLTLLQSFGLGSLLGFAIDLMILIHIIHTFLRSTFMWKSLGLNKSPFNEISNSGYFYSTLVLSVTLLAVNLISTTSLDGTILTLMDTIYTLLFIRYVFLYGEYLDSKKISINNEGNFEQIADTVAEGVNNFMEENKLDKAVENIKGKVSDFVDDLSDAVVNIKENIEDKIEEAKLDEKFEAAKKKVSEVTSDLKEKATDIKENVEKRIEEAELDDKFDKAKGQVSGFVNDLGEDVKNFVKDAKVGEKIENAKKKVNNFVEEKKLDEKFEAAKKKVSVIAKEVSNEISDFVEEKKLDEKFETAKKKVGDFAKEVSNDISEFVKDAKVEEKVEKAKNEVSRFVNEVKDDMDSLVGKDSKTKGETKEKKTFFSRKKKAPKEKSSKPKTKKGSK